MAQSGGDILHRGGNSAGWASPWKKLLDSSNYSQYALPLTGGEINNGVANNTPLIIRSGHSNSTAIGFKNSNGSILGYLGADSSHQAVFNDSSTTHVLLHSGNCSNYCVVNGSVPNFGGVSLGNSFPYIYTENNNINFRYQNNGNTVYTSLLEINSAINILYADKQNALSKSHIGSVDLNNIVDTGIYMIGGGVSNIPFQWGILLVFNPNYAYIGQIGIGSNGLLYHRFRNETGIWTAWHKNTSTAT